MYLNMKHTVAELEYYILQYLEGMTFPMLKNLGLQYENTYFLFKVRLYQQHGIDGLQPPNKHQHYSSNFREQVAQEHLVDKISIYELAIKYNIPSQKTIRSWIFRYTNGGESQSYNSKTEVYLMKGKKTTYEEKLHIVLDYLKNDLSYRETAEKFQVSYNNVYAWVNKYKKHGPDGLIDSRGRSKPTAILTDKERLNVENKALKARNEYLEMENDALKKLQEVERELMLAKQGSKQSIKRLKNFTKKKPTK